MKALPTVTLALALASFSTACVTSTTTTRTWGGASGEQWARNGRVEQIQEVITQQHGDPVGGAVAGALIGGVLGSALGSHTHYDRWGGAHTHGSATGALVGAAGGAAVGAAASQGSAEQRTYNVSIRFDDGGYETYAFQGYAPFNVGDLVLLTPQGLSRR